MGFFFLFLKLKFQKTNPDSLSAGGMAKRIGINEFNAPLLAVRIIKLNFDIPLLIAGKFI
jgi:hypothetical protein